MQFWLSTVGPTAFAVILDENGAEIAIKTWTGTRHDAENIAEFLKKHRESLKSVKKLVGVTGPGGFSRLRIVSSMLNALSLAFNAKTYGISAFLWAEALKKEQNANDSLVDSYSDLVFVGSNPEKAFLVQELPQKVFETTLINQKKREKIQNGVSMPFELTKNILYRLFNEAITPFQALYGHAAVQG